MGRIARRGCTRPDVYKRQADQSEHVIDRSRNPQDNRHREAKRHHYISGPVFIRHTRGQAVEKTGYHQQAANYREANRYGPEPARLKEPGARAASCATRLVSQGDGRHAAGQITCAEAKTSCHPRKVADQETVDRDCENSKAWETT